MLDRYSRKEMSDLWSLENKYKTWLIVEKAVAQAQAKLKLIPQQASDVINNKAKFDAQEIAIVEQEVKHDVIAFLTNVGKSIGDDSRFLHFGLTSSDILDTSLALTLGQSIRIILKDLNDLKHHLINLAKKHKNSIQIGRSHGIHAEPITFGYKMLTWVDEIERHESRLKQLIDYVMVGKISGAVGTYSTIGTQVEIETCAILNLKPSRIATQIVSRDIHAQYLQTLALISSSIEKFAIEIRHLQRTDVLEVEEPFAIGQKGSSAMPHKRNPIGCENISGLCRIIRSNSLAGLENIALWHERDMSHSSVERIVLPDSSILLDYIVDRFSGIMKNLMVYPENMLNNLNKFGGVIYSQTVLLKLIEHGLSREQAYKVVQNNAHKAWNTKEGNFKLNLLNDQEITKIITKEEIESLFNPKNFLKYIDEVYQRFNL